MLRSFLPSVFLIVISVISVISSVCYAQSDTTQDPSKFIQCFQKNEIKDSLLTAAWTKPFHFRNTNTLEFNKKGNKVISGGPGGIKIIEPRDTGYRLLHEFKPYKYNYSVTKWSRDEKYIVIGSYGGFSIFNATNFTLVFQHKYTVPDRWVQDVFFNDKNQMLVTDWHGFAVLYSFALNKVIKEYTDKENKNQYCYDTKYFNQGFADLLMINNVLPAPRINNGASETNILYPQDSSLIFKEYYNNQDILIILNFYTSKLKKMICTDSIVFDLHYFVSDSVPYILYGSKADLFRVNLVTNEIVRIFHLNIPDHTIAEIETNVDKKYILLASEDRGIVKRSYLIKIPMR